MLIVHLDPGILAVPNYAQSPGEADELISRIEEWSSRASRNQVVLTRSTDCDDILAQANAYPAYEPIRDMLEMFSISHVYAARDVSKMINTIIDRSRIVLDVTGSEVTKLESCVITPPVLDGLAPVALQASSQRAYATASYFLTNDDAFALVLASATCCPNLGLVGVKAAGELAVGTIGAVADLNLDGHAVHLSGLSGVVNSLSAATLLERASDASDIHLAIATRAAEIYGCGLDGVPTFTVGSEFLASLNESQAGKGGAFSSVTLECCARLVMNDPKNEVSVFKDRAGAQKTRSSDGATGWRSHITKGKAALRLMIWKAGNSLELANVGEKHDLDIEQGSSMGAYSGNYA